MKTTLFSVLFFALHLINAQDSNHSILSIPEGLTNNANAVVRLDDMLIDMASPYKMRIIKHYIITVLNKYGDDYANIYVHYNNHVHIRSIKASIYNAFGSEIKKVKSKDIKDYSASGGSLYTDYRVKYYKYIPLKYPYTIDYTIIKDSENTAFMPDWNPLWGYNISTQESRFNVKYPKNQLKIRLKEENLKKLNINNFIADGAINYNTKLIKAIEREPYSPIFSEFEPSLKLAPSKFNLAGVKGSANNWNEFGQWMYSNLLLGRDQLPEETKSEIRQLVKGIDDPIERARKVYTYMQDKTRYISIQVGIGGWKPMLAEEVDKMKYGDCKALVNYTQSLLKAANVNAYYTLVFAKAKKNIDKDFIAVQGNHAILYLPTPKDTVWLECTTQTNPFGYVGHFTNDRDVLVVKSDGAQIKHTTSYKSSESYQNSSGFYSVDTNGSLKGQLNIESSGIQFDNHFYTDDKAKDEIVKHYKSYFRAINNLVVVKFNNKTDTIKNKFKEHIEIEATNYGRKSGDRMLLTVNAFNKSSYVPKRLANRILPIEISNGFIDRDSITISLPTNYKIEAAPSASQIKTKYGVYNSEVMVKNDSTVVYIRSLTMNKGYYPKEEYNKFRKFKKSIVRKDNSKIILIKE
ncbi:MAG: DUF3857 domain-containing protein [Flavobacteriaceae bacterium]|nr:DUF3857 domain-containing protein [Flavobacteriaceae bacterium]